MRDVVHSSSVRIPSNAPFSARSRSISEKASLAAFSATRRAARSSLPRRAWYSCRHRRFSPAVLSASRRGSFAIARLASCHVAVADTSASASAARNAAPRPPWWRTRRARAKTSTWTSTWTPTWTPTWRRLSRRRLSRRRRPPRRGQPPARRGARPGGSIGSPSCRDDGSRRARPRRKPPSTGSWRPRARWGSSARGVSRTWTGASPRCASTCVGRRERRVRSTPRRRRARRPAGGGGDGRSGRRRESAGRRRTGRGRHPRGKRRRATTTRHARARNTHPTPGISRSANRARAREWRTIQDVDQVVPVLVIVVVVFTRRISTRHDDFGCFVQCVVYSSKPFLHPSGRAALRAPQPGQQLRVLRRPRPSAAAVLATSSSRISRAASNTLMRSPTEVIPKRVKCALAERSKRRGVHPVRAKLRAEMRESIPTERLHDGFVVPDAFGHLLREVLRGFPLRDEREGEGGQPGGGREARARVRVREWGEGEARALKMIPERRSCRRVRSRPTVRFPRRPT